METLKSGREFNRAFSQGIHAAHPLVHIKLYINTEGGPGKVAFVAAKRFGNAVWRNRAKRVLRHAAQLAGLPQENADIILFATAQTPTTNPNDIAAVLPKLIKRANKRERGGKE